MSAIDYLAPRLCRAAAVLHAGGVIAYPTEGVYGLGCRPDDWRAVQRLLKLKDRRVSAGLILIAASLDQLDGWIAPTRREARPLSESNGGAVTWIVTAGPMTPDWITGGRTTVAVRVTRHPVAAGLCLASGLPLVSTSANRRGKPAARSSLGVRCRFGHCLDLIVGGSTGGAAGPTEIRHADSGQVIRAG